MPCFSSSGVAFRLYITSIERHLGLITCLRSALSPKCPSPCVPCTLLDLCGSSHTNAQSTDAPSCFRSRNGLGNVGLNEMQNGICRHMSKSTNNFKSNKPCFLHTDCKMTKHCLWLLGRPVGEVRLLSFRLLVALVSLVVSSFFTSRKRNTFAYLHHACPKINQPFNSACDLQRLSLDGSLAASFSPARNS